MGDTPLTNMDHLIEQAQGSLDRVLQSRVTIASNSIEIYSLFEHMHIALIQTDPDFISIISNEDSGENSSDPTMESLLQDINELIIKIDEIIG